ncbi:MAG TPA: MoaD/ThiS family protein [Acidimicrobiales bacterium]|jgi:sulfite reductase beta subunit-like hemoprotein/molybdopterin converting factor small subunit|nr:MoaD/ThiS family protein [Acidimicrobiales bacterium]
MTITTDSNSQLGDTARPTGVPVGDGGVGRRGIGRPGSARGHSSGPGPEPTWDLVVKRNAIERRKREKFPLDIIDELPEMIARGYEAIPEEDIVFLSWWGLMHDKPKVGTFMVRVKVPGGRILPSQLDALGRLSRDYGRNYGELTTRQGIQLHWVRLDQLPEVLGAIEAAGLTTAGGEGDTVRNVTSCPVAGIDRAELFDVSPLVAEVARFFSGNRDYSDLPRKHKYTISACPAQCNAPEIHDVALVGTLRDGRPGFGVRVGGGLSATPRLSRDLKVFVPAAPTEGVIEVLRAITDVWQTNLRYRVSRVKARIKFMVDDYGPDGVRALVEERLGRRLEDGEAPPAAFDDDHLGVRPQRQEGLAYVGVPVPMGWVRGDQLVALGDLLGSFGGEARFTRAQNLIVANVPEGRVPWLVRELEAIGLEPNRSKLYARSVACTDHQFCNYSVAETKGKLRELLAELERRFGAGAVEELRIHMDGCPHACAQHWMGDVGLQGTTATDPATGRRIQAYNLRLRGGMGTRAAIGVPVLRRIPEEEVTEVVARLVGAWLAERDRSGGSLDFAEFLARHDDDEIRTICAAGEDERPGETARPRAQVRVPGMLIEATGGADVVDVEPATIGAVLAELKARYPALVAQVLGPDGEVAASINLFIGEEDVRALGGMDAKLAAGQELTILPALSGGAW